VQHLTLRQLEVFVAIALHGTTGRGADATALSQSAASAALAELERQLGTALFDRIGRQLRLNESGRLLLPRATALLEQAADIGRLFAGEAASLRLGASTTVGNYLLPPLIAAFRRDNPQARLRLDVANSADIVAAVADFAVDGGFIEGVCRHPDLVVTPWLQDELVVFAGRDHPLAHQPITRDALAGVEWVLRETGSGTREVLEQLLVPLLGNLRVPLALGNSEAVKRTVAAGLGVSCLSRHVVADLLASGAVVDLGAAPGLPGELAGLNGLSRPLYFVRHRQKPLQGGLARFLAASLAGGKASAAE
jgi:DNA-binding transcriptional LysR family regulator